MSANTIEEVEFPYRVCVDTTGSGGCAPDGWEEFHPSTRTFSPGSFPETTFEAQNGAKSFIRYGNKRVNTTMTIGYNNMKDYAAAVVLAHYDEVSRDPSKVIVFSTVDALAGLGHVKKTGLAGGGPVANSLVHFMKGDSYGNNSQWQGLRWRFSGPPKYTSTFVGTCNLTCSFVGCLHAD